ncbi:LysM peptidoglycan-binding domain-containing protein [Streptomyces inhibens]|uniref:LysM peptidoglycan-binding domain-containing protein n=1 Tax=Streptomyces inhibens TaxID=2293571 RepID=UPI0036C90FE1
MIEPYERALDEVPGAHPYARSSRYSGVEIGVYRAPDGTEVRYAKRRLLPPLADAAEETVSHVVRSGERPDQLGQRYFGDPGQWWQIADANPILDPRELTDEPGEEIAVPLAGGFAGGTVGPGVRNG